MADLQSELSLTRTLFTAPAPGRSGQRLRSGRIPVTWPTVSVAAAWGRMTGRQFSWPRERPQGAAAVVFGLTSSVAAALPCDPRQETGGQAQAIASGCLGDRRRGQSVGLTWPRSAPPWPC